MAKKGARSCANIIAIPDEDFCRLEAPSCTFYDNSIEALSLLGTFPTSTVFKPFDVRIQPDFISSVWLCFPKYPLTLGLVYPFSRILSKFFEMTKISYIKTMSAVWRILYWIDNLNRSIGLNICLNELAFVYDLSNLGNSRFLLKFKTEGSPHVLKSKHNDIAWNGGYFL